MPQLTKTKDDNSQIPCTSKDSKIKKESILLHLSLQACQ